MLVDRFGDFADLTVCPSRRSKEVSCSAVRFLLGVLHDGIRGGCERHLLWRIGLPE